MPLKYYPGAYLGSLSAIEVILEKFGGGVHRGREREAWLREMVDLAEEAPGADSDYPSVIEDASGQTAHRTTVIPLAKGAARTPTGAAGQRV